ncbi:MAG: hypothetical protein JXK95_16910 [Bacteroidales bacterium]|nr:hypothetical protein [Bacteroidales bacterium]
MKKFFFIILFLPGCHINRLSDRIEIPPDQVWEVYNELHVIKVDSLRRYQVVTAVPFGKTYPKYAYQWHDRTHSTCVGDIVPLTDSLRSRIVYKQNWEKAK